MSLYTDIMARWTQRSVLITTVIRYISVNSIGLLSILRHATARTPNNKMKPNGTDYEH